ncbi:gliding motility-associated-like protein [Mangrovibacterium marinum]|uniref:Gliding motility-associated-like protein n=1 Tax=Mangrovibacterium marinum TaxID=1639118 RepID=A0A2T5BYP2_9BACT|nr:gliding motility-associated C-terminal domain-containing protein [Mangrovibacterium marinum]PTN07339.1 gliding motility-associated-like protein [Mangrovibacterium marinum]
MNRLWYHTRKLALAILPVVFAVASATAQYTVYQGQTSTLSIDPLPGDSYSWELYTDSTVNFATTDGYVPPEMAEFVNGVSTGPSVQVIWHEPGVYFYKVEAWNAIACTNHLKIGRIEILELKQEIIPPVAVDDYYTVDCDPLFDNVTENDSWDSNYNIIVNILEWPLKGDLFPEDDQGSFSYYANFELFGIDSFRYELCLDIEDRLCDTATVYITIPDDLDCEPEPDTTCHFFIPEGFSPNGDGAHDYFVIDCIEQYPDATLMIFDKQGYLLYKHKNYGNVNVWGTNEADLWWGGQTIKHHQNKDRMVVPGVYLYILDKGNGDYERGFVMVAYGLGSFGN